MRSQLLSSLMVLALAGCGGAPSRPPRPAPAAPSPTPAPPATRQTSEVAEPTQAPEAEAPQVAALLQALLARLTVWRRADGTRVLSRRCREGPVDCRARLAAFARLFVETGRRHDLDPFLLAALAMRESGLDPAALGRRREAGIVQLHPRGAGRGVRFVQDARYRERCQSEIAACQGPVLERGASYLADSVRECGGLVAGLGRYASGHCTERGVHPQHVLEERDQLRRLAEER